jgi:site-specific DNA recombinase
MSELRDLIRKQRIDVVVATTLDRISRSQTHQTIVLYEAEERDVRLELTEERYEDTDTGRLMRIFSGFFAEIEREKIQGRTLRGKHQRARQGKMLPSNIPLYGYSWADENKTRYVVNPTTSPIALRIWNEAASGKPVRRIAIELTKDGIDCPRDAWRREKGDPSDPPRGNCWVYNTVRGILHNPAYWGNHTAFRWDKTTRRRNVDPITGDATRVRETRQREVGDGRYALPGAAPALISPDLAKLVHERLARNKEEAARKSKHPEGGLLRAGFIKCGACGGKMNCVMGSGHAYTYRCPRAIRTVSTHQCTNKVFVRAKKIDTDVWGRLMAVLQDPEYIEQEMMPLLNEDSRQDAIRALIRRLKELDAEEGNLVRLARKIGDDAGSDKLIVELELVANEKQGVQNELRQLEQDERDQEAARERLKAVKVMVAGIVQAGEQFTYAKKRAFLWMLNVQVTVLRVERDLHVDVTAGRHGEMKLLRLAQNDAMYCDRTIATVQ